MQQFSFYQASEGALDKAICSLTERCYQSQQSLVIWVAEEQRQEQLNDLLWTYSQKQFIPHGSRLDPQPAMQPVYISNKIEVPNSASIVMLTDYAGIDHSSTDPISTPDQSISKNQPLPASSLKQFKRVLIVYDIADQVVYRHVAETIEQLKAMQANISCYVQSNNGLWTQPA